MSGGDCAFSNDFPASLAVSAAEGLGFRAPVASRNEF